MSGDTISDLLKTVRMTGAVFFEITAGDDWSVGSPTPEMMLPRILPGADHLVAFHVVTAGHCYAGLHGGESQRIDAGEVIVFSRGQPHVVSSAPGQEADPIATSVLDIAMAGLMPYCLQFGCSGSVQTRIVCGYLACDSSPFNPLIDNLPPMIKGGRPRDGRPGWLDRFIEVALAESTERRAGSETMLTKLSELMFIDLLRNYIETLPSERSGWLAGVRDPSVGRALGLLHGKPAHDWSIENLAKASGVSRSVMAERFTSLVGIPPMAYLAKWRMQIAAETLAHGNATMAEIADKVGYDSEASFSRAFKKLIGVPPSQWRRRETAERKS